VHARYGRISNKYFTANLLENLTVKRSENWLRINSVTTVSVCLLFWNTCTLRDVAQCNHKAIGNESVPIQLAQCWFPRLAISSAKIYIYFLHKIFGSNFIKQHSETGMV